MITKCNMAATVRHRKSDWSCLKPTAFRASDTVRKSLLSLMDATWMTNNQTQIIIQAEELSKHTVRSQCLTSPEGRYYTEYVND